MFNVPCLPLCVSLGATMPWWIQLWQLNCFYKSRPIGTRITRLLHLFQRASLTSYANNIKTQKSTSITFIKQRFRNNGHDSTRDWTVRCSNPSRWNIFFSSPKLPDRHWSPSSWPVQWVPNFFCRKTDQVGKLTTIPRLLSMLRGQAGQFHLSPYSLCGTFISFI